jgi:hypothetical protein
MSRLSFGLLVVTTLHDGPPSEAENQAARKQALKNTETLGRLNALDPRD